MSIFSKFFRPKPQRPFVEYPDGRLGSAMDALVEGIRLYRADGGDRRAFISWQGQGSRLDSYHIVDARLEGDYLGFDESELGLERICVEEGLSYASLRGRAPSELKVGSISDAELAGFLQRVLTKHLSVRPFQDTGEYCVGFEYEMTGRRDR
jgi:hypothetical protein